MYEMLDLAIFDGHLKIEKFREKIGRKIFEITNHSYNIYTLKLFDKYVQQD